MVHERDDKYEGQEDGEYHFSDDQANYDMEPEVVKLPASDTKPAAGLKGVTTVYRKQIIGVVVFIVLIFLVYKISAPTQTTPTTPDFTQNNARPIATKPTTNMAEKKPSNTMQSLPAPTPLPAAPAPAEPQPTATMPSTSVVSTAPAVEPTPITPPSQGLPNTVSQPEPVAPPSNPAPVVTTIQGPAPVPAGDKLAMLEEQNAKLSAMFSQKVSEFEAQNVALESKLQDINMRMATLEATLTKIAKSMQETKITTRVERAQTPIIMSGPRVNYTVQAIIPGRAWLKSEGGETVTVAEGDILKGYGRVMKIDPYDGIVEIDTGGKTLTLSYGVTSE